MKMNRRDFLKVIALAAGTAVATQIPIPRIPYALPYWKDVMRPGQTYQIAYRWDKYGKTVLTVDGMECDPRDDFCVRDDDVKAHVISFVKSNDFPEGTATYKFHPEKLFFEDHNLANDDTLIFGSGYIEQHGYIDTMGANDELS